MGSALSTADPELRDVVAGSPVLVDADTGVPTGARLRRWLGSGGMAAVFLAEVDGEGAATRSWPARLAIKLLKPEAARRAARRNADASDGFVREALALTRMMERKPPTAFVVGFHGSGTIDLDTPDGPVRVPWLAIEHVDGGGEGVTLTERVRRASGGVDPVRALRLLRGIVAGVEALHESGIIHRDLKPDNVLVAGPVDDETPKLADCGIARVDGLTSTLAAMTPTYGGPEQHLSRPDERNPLIGPWTDVHALAAVAFFLLGGEDWCRGTSDVAWHRGKRRSLRTAAQVHPSLLADADLLEALDRALAQGAAQRPPAAAFRERDRAAPYEELAQRTLPSMLSGPERFGGVADFARAVLPLLERAASR